jgi:hypothetical protein
VPCTAGWCQRLGEGVLELYAEAMAERDEE